MLRFNRWLLLVSHQTTPNPLSRMFTGPKFLHPGQAIDFPNVGHAYKSPLVARLYDVSGPEVLRSVYITDAYMTLTLDGTTVGDTFENVWNDLTPKFSAEIEKFVVPGEPMIQNLLSSEAEEQLSWNEDDTEPQPDDSEVVLAVKELIAARIRPMLQGDGGNLKFVGFDEGLVYVVLQGACVTCPSSQATLKNGIERMLMHWVPEVLEVQEVDEDFARHFMEEEKKKKAAAAAKKD
eukprot:PhF_6_TR38891/c0_g1_i1/m.58171/K22074/NFU1, HIRIP5; NFU1 iron-sulfur cluster scaffold homolog, mitochondrial